MFDFLFIFILGFICLLYIFSSNGWVPELETEWNIYLLFSTCLLTMTSDLIITQISIAAQEPWSFFWFQTLNIHYFKIVFYSYWCPCGLDYQVTCRCGKTMCYVCRQPIQANYQHFCQVLTSHSASSASACQYLSPCWRSLGCL